MIVPRKLELGITLADSAMHDLFIYLSRVGRRSWDTDESLQLSLTRRPTCRTAADGPHCRAPGLSKPGAAAVSRLDRCLVEDAGAAAGAAGCQTGCGSSKRGRYGRVLRGRCIHKF